MGPAAFPLRVAVSPPALALCGARVGLAAAAGRTRRQRLGDVGDREPEVEQRVDRGVEGARRSVSRGAGACCGGSSTSTISPRTGRSSAASTARRRARESAARTLSSVRAPRRRAPPARAGRSLPSVATTRCGDSYHAVAPSRASARRSVASRRSAARGRKPPNSSPVRSKPDSTAAHTKATGPGQHLDRHAGRARSHDQFAAGIAHAGRAGVGHDGDEPGRRAPQDLVRGYGRILLAIRQQRLARDAVGAEQAARHAGVLGHDDVAVPEHVERARRDVAKVAERRRHERQAQWPPSCARSNSTATSSTRGYSAACSRSSWTTSTRAIRSTTSRSVTRSTIPAAPACASKPTPPTISTSSSSACAASASRSWPTPTQSRSPPRPTAFSPTRSTRRPTSRRTFASRAAGYPSRRRGWTAGSRSASTAPARCASPTSSRASTSSWARRGSASTPRSAPGGARSSSSCRAPSRARNPRSR